MKGEVVIVRSGGDIASGVIQKLHRTGFRVLVLEIEKPTSIRRTVCFSEAVYDGKMELEGITSILVKNIVEIYHAWANDYVPVIVDPKGEYIEKFKPIAVVDAIIAKRNTGMHKGLAPITIGMGPGFTAGNDCSVVIESNRGHNMGRLIFEGSAEPNTGMPGNIAGYTTERVLKSPDDGIITLEHNIGDTVKSGDVIAYVNGQSISSQIDGIVRGLIREGTYVTKGFKVGDIDPRIEQLKNCYTISDKARAIGGAVLEAILIETEKIKSL